MQITFCEESTCENNVSGICVKTERHICQCQTGIEQGKALIFPVCRDYKEIKDAGTD